MTSALIPLAASSLLALSGAPAGQGASKAGQQGQAAHAPAAQAPAARGQSPVAQAPRPGVSRPATRNGGEMMTARSGAAPSSHARTAPDRSGSSSAQATSGGSPPPSSSGAHGAPPRSSSSNAVQAHPTQGGHATRPAPQAARPAHHSAHGSRPAHAPAHRYGPWNPTPHRTYVVRHHHVSPWHPRYWTAGVFVYEAPPRAVVTHGRAPARTAAPEREIDRESSLSVGVRSGSYMSGYENQASYGDFGLGLSARYRGNEALGVEVSYGYFNDDFTKESERVTQPISASVELFAFPWTEVSPYVLGGVTWTKRTYNDTYTYGSLTETFEKDDVQFGPHGGVGIELAVSQKASINLEGRYTHFVTHETGEDASAPGALQGLVGVNLYF